MIPPLMVPLVAYLGTLALLLICLIILYIFDRPKR